MIRTLIITIPDGSKIIYKGEATSIDVENGELEFLAVPLFTGKEIPTLSITEKKGI